MHNLNLVRSLAGVAHLEYHRLGILGGEERQGEVLKYCCIAVGKGRATYGGNKAWKRKGQILVLNFHFHVGRLCR